MLEVRAPGRVNLIGEHTDYNDGFVLPLAIDLECRLVGRASQDRSVCLSSDAFDPEVTLSLDPSIVPRHVEPAWGRLAAGVIVALARRGRPPVGLEARLHSSVPVGKGLSSSAAFAVALAAALCRVARFDLDPLEIARSCQEAELAASGVPCGIMDQLASLFGRRGCALLIDCRSLAIEAIPLPSSLAVLVVDSGVKRTVEHTAYADRRAECETVARALSLAALRDATPEQVADEARARHVVSENSRVLAFADALRQGDVEELGHLLLASHASLRDDFEVSTPEIDTLVERLVEAGALGARLTGAGFGGSVVALAPRERVAAIAKALEDRPVLVCHAVDGAAERTG